MIEDRQLEVLNDMVRRYDAFYEVIGVYPNTLIMGEYYYKLLFNGFKDKPTKIFACDIIMLPNFDYAFTIYETKDMVELIKNGSKTKEY